MLNELNLGWLWIRAWLEFGRQAAKEVVGGEVTCCSACSDLIYIRCSC